MYDVYIYIYIKQWLL